MGRIVVSENITLDGVAEEPAGAGDGGEGRSWVYRLSDADRAGWAEAEFRESREAAALLMGRRTHAWFLARGWAAREGDWADRLRDLPKYVVASAALEGPDWGNTTVLGGGAAKEAAALRDAVDGDVVVYGSVRLVRELLAHDLVDEVRLTVFPVVAGAGQRLFGATDGLREMRVAGVRTLGEGLPHLTYRPVGSGRPGGPGGPGRPDREG